MDEDEDEDEERDRERSRAKRERRCSRQRCGDVKCPVTPHSHSPQLPPSDQSYVRIRMFVGAGGGRK